MSLVLRDPAPADARHLAEVQRSAWYSTYQGLFSKQFMEKRLSGAEQRFGSLLERRPEHVSLKVVDCDDQTAGFTCVRPRGLSEDLQGAELTSIYVHPGFQRRGAGSLLLSFALGQAERAGCLYLWVFEKNLSALGFYHASGFTPDGARSEWHPGGATLIRLVKSL